MSICPVNPFLFADNSTGVAVCVAICPANTYGVISTRTCVTTCPTNFYADTKTKICVSICSQNNSLTYYENGVCVTTCTNGIADPNTMTCILGPGCPTSLYYPILFAYQGICVSKCPNNKFGDLENKICVDLCSGIYYADNSTNTCVLTCPTNPSYYADSNSNICVFTCSSGYSDNSTRKCVEKCPINYSAYDPTMSCVLNCPSLYYTNLDATTGASSCVQSCSLNFIDYTTLSCVAECPYLYFK